MLVVGGGPAGSATALLLAAAGRSVMLVDRATFPRDKACSEYMSPEAVRILDRLGVVGALEEAGAVPLAGTTVTAARGARLQGRFALAGHRPFRPTGLSVSRRILDHRLLVAARRAGATVLERTAVESLAHDAEGVAGAVVRTADGERVTVGARLTVGADGLRSVVGRRLGGWRQGGLRRVAFVGHVEGVEGMSDCAEMFVGRRGYLGLNPIGGGRTNVALVVPLHRAGAARGRTEAFFHEGLADFPGVSRRVGGGRLVRRVLATGPFAARSGRVTAGGRRAGRRRGGLLRSLHRRGYLQRAPRRGAVGRDGGRRAGPTGPGHGRRARALPSRAAASLQRQVGGRAADRLRRCTSPSCSIARSHGSPAAVSPHTLIGVTADFVPARVVLNPVFLARMLL